jgi:lipoprotein-releasing system ATP-binding protein
MSKQSPEVILKTADLHKSYIDEERELKVLRGINLEVKKGEFLSIVGSSGTGKSTLLHLLGGLDRPTRGELFLKGKNIFQLNDRGLAELRNRQVGFIFQFHYLLPEFTALENVTMPGLIGLKGREGLGGESSEKIREKARNILIELGLGKRMNHRPAELSGGESQRVAVARALINEPEVILADEPTGNLDKENGEIVFQLLKKLNTRGETLIIVTHNEQLASRTRGILRLADGLLSLSTSP